MRRAPCIPGAFYPDPLSRDAQFLNSVGDLIGIRSSIRRHAATADRLNQVEQSLAEIQAQSACQLKPCSSVDTKDGGSVTSYDVELHDKETSADTTIQHITRALNDAAPEGMYWQPSDVETADAEVSSAAGSVKASGSV